MIVMTIQNGEDEKMIETIYSKVNKILMWIAFPGKIFLTLSFWVTRKVESLPSSTSFLFQVV